MVFLMNTPESELAQGIEKIRHSIKADLYIQRVPKPTLAWFKDYAQAEFAGDYGMLLRELVQFYRGQFLDTHLAGIEDLHAKVDEVLKRLEPEPEPETKKRVMADGTER